jgi:hypothetical protein
MSIATILQAARLTRARLLSLALAPVLLASGCATMNNTEKGVLGGAALGGIAGGLMGGAVGKPGAGAAIGAGLGGIGGGLVGNAVDESEARQNARAVTAVHGPLGLTDVAQMAQQHISDSVIIGQIRSTGSVYNLSPNDIYWLKENGVSDVVIQEMQRTQARGKRVHAPAPVYERVYVVEPAPPPPVVGVGFSYTNRRCR